MSKIYTADVGREAMGVGSVRNPKHMGLMKRSTEVRSKLENWSPTKQRTPEDFRREREERKRAEELEERRKRDLRAGVFSGENKG